MKKLMITMMALAAVSAFADITPIYYSGGYNEGWGGDPANITAGTESGDATGISFNYHIGSSYSYYMTTRSTGGMQVIYNINSSQNYTATTAVHADRTYTGIAYNGDVYTANGNNSAYKQYYMAARADGGVDRMYGANWNGMTRNDSWFGGSTVFNGITHNVSHSYQHYYMVALATGGIQAWYSSNGAQNNFTAGDVINSGTIYSGIAYNIDKAGTGQYYMASKADGGVDVFTSTALHNGVTLDTGSEATAVEDITGSYAGLAYDSRHPSINTYYMGAAIPEPATLGLVAMVGGGMLFVRRKLMI